MAYTYVHNRSRTQIDYILTRKYQGTYQMRGCKPIHSFPVAAWRTCGMHHPLLLPVDYTWQPGPPSHASRLKINEEQLRQEMQSHTMRYQQYQRALYGSIHNIQEINMNHINQQIQQISHQYYPMHRTMPTTYHEHASVQHVIRQKWQLLAAMRRTAGTTLKRVFSFWSHFIQFRKTKQQANKASRQARRDKYECSCRRLNDMPAATTPTQCSESYVGWHRSRSTRRFRFMGHGVKFSVALVKHKPYMILKQMLGIRLPLPVRRGPSHMPSCCTP